MDAKFSKGDKVRVKALGNMIGFIDIDVTLPHIIVPDYKLEF
jgi:hypothetical protein